MRGKRIRAIRILLIGVVSILFFSVIVGAAVQNDDISQKEIEEMNQQELHYDADGYFLMLNTNIGLLGFYNGSEPVKHIKVTNQIKVNNPVYGGIAEGVYQVHYAQNGLFFTTQSSCMYENEPFVLVISNSAEIPDGTPLLVYNR